jgi:hypothetical protein
MADEGGTQTKSDTDWPAHLRQWLTILGTQCGCALNLNRIANHPVYNLLVNISIIIRLELHLIQSSTKVKVGFLAVSLCLHHELRADLDKAVRLGY